MRKNKDAIIKDLANSEREKIIYKERLEQINRITNKWLIGKVSTGNFILKILKLTEE